MSDLIERLAAIDMCMRVEAKTGYDAACLIAQLPSVQPTLYGYNVEHLELIARVLQKEDLPPDRVAEALTDIGRIVAIVKDELEEALKKEMWEYGRDRLD